MNAPETKGEDDEAEVEPLETFRILPMTLARNGHHYKQVARVEGGNSGTGDLAIYEQWTKGETPKIVAWEVIRVRRHEGGEIMGNKIPPGESYPGSEDWGRHGWTLTSLDAAWGKIRFLQDGEETPTSMSEAEAEKPQEAEKAQEAQGLLGLEI
jgi:hypothetical protein